ncbi:hypothetical protein [Kitasatospora sp. DSM 101779]|uniref:hypothetical protein n=1 Tax=Kitasatospora sp. DSM 101779 TaxID=2853165 RepID=UPI0021D87929|nr:hypothetical protein [Kitasatospora sp. DSM 101779]MCU7821249.1 hypothetical protein [Kitasatospora sp. DSM 101779]
MLSATGGPRQALSRVCAPLLAFLTALFAFWAVAAGDDDPAARAVPTALALAFGALAVLAAAHPLVFARCRRRRPVGRG